MSAALSLAALPGIPLIQPGDDLGALLIAALERHESLLAGDVLVIAQKIVSKAEGRYVDLRTVAPSARAKELAAATAKDPRLVEVILRESANVVRYREDVLIVTHRLGFVMANAGVDRSNIVADEQVLLLPADPDASCRALRARLGAYFGVAPAVIINDSVGRAWRNGTVGIALGAAGLPALYDQRGEPDLFGEPLRVTQVGFADEIAAAASLLMGQADQGLPLVRVRGLRWPREQENDAAALLRPPAQDLFR